MVGTSAQREVATPADRGDR